MRKPLPAGKLRHRVRIEAPRRIQDPETGALVETWQTFDDVYAAIEPLSARDFIAAQMAQSKVSVRITIRHRHGLNTTMRLVGPDGTVYTPSAFLHDADTGREYLTVPCSC